MPSNSKSYALFGKWRKWLLIFLFAAFRSNGNSTSRPLKKNWKAYQSRLPVPKVIDLRDGHHVDMQMARSRHYWEDGDGDNGGLSDIIYGYGLLNDTPSFPGPTILVSRKQAVNVTWYNRLGRKHVLDDFVEDSLLRFTDSHCYPHCGVPAVVHVHGLEASPQNDGMPRYSIYDNQSTTATYLNAQSPSTKLYHDHAIGLARLSVWAGLVGLYVIQDEELDKRLNIPTQYDYPLMLADRILDESGKLLYSQYQCEPTANTKWVPESFGTVNTVNGKVMPFLEVPPRQIRFRFANIANARHYNLSIPFYKYCETIATDSGYVENVLAMKANLVLYPFERLEVVCDFTQITQEEVVYEVVDHQTAVQDTHYDSRAFQLRVLQRLASFETITPIKKMLKTLVKYKDLKTLWKQSGGKERLIRLGEYEHHLNCPSKAMIIYQNQELSLQEVTGTIHCTYGKVEKWNFKNPTDEAHPFHWHLVNAQCGPNDDEIDKNALKDVVAIPSDPSNKVSQVCYVACTPDEYLVHSSNRSAKGYDFDPTAEPYLVHCHTMEHEANQMASFFQLTAADDTLPNETGSATNRIPTSIVLSALGMSVLAGIATIMSTLVVSCKCLMILAKPRSLAAAFALSAGVMIFIAFADLWSEAVTYYRASFTVGGNGDAEAYEHGGNASQMGTCDRICSGKSWLATCVAFSGGVLMIYLVEILVHKCFGHRSNDSHDNIGDRGMKPHFEAPLAEPRSNTSCIKIKDGISTTEDHFLAQPSSISQQRCSCRSASLHAPNAITKEEFERTGIMTGIAIAIHNFPEGLALFVSSLQGLKTGVTLSIGIILHNFPEGVAIAAPIYYGTGSICQALKWTTLSGIAQPMGALMGWIVVSGGLTSALQATMYAVVAGMLMAITAIELVPGAFRFDPSGKFFSVSLFVGIAIIAISLVFLHYAGSA
uniref:Uncharacterized protein AlNc14C290G10229 n=1 Tax=Albugo laibachii Nc14 TaxID=890382 RepID=F0WV84_9STRA|nr:conserved hypothetical protein [Albugo laibachii Nc14]|eukprot:CCA25323.1 conserved hypothetical protein [Albugo laibachii Nc14]